jgi:mannan endo-1,4-beta-mannosidase
VLLLLICAHALAAAQTAGSASDSVSDPASDSVSDPASDSVSSPVADSLHVSDGFYVSEGRLFDANGNEFIMRGVNSGVVWYLAGSHNKLGIRSMDYIAETGANTLRIAWERNTTRLGLPADSRKLFIEAVSRAIELEMVAVVSLWDGGGSNSVPDLMANVDWWLQDEIKDFLNENRRYVLLNIANEWGGHNLAGFRWMDAYKQAITRLREAGVKNTLVIDASGWGQSIVPIRYYAGMLLDHDPDRNLLFSVHMYGSWNNADDITKEFEWAKQNKIPLIVGEFGYDYANGNNNLGCRVDADRILAECDRLGIGWLAWSWGGNNKENAWLDLTQRDWRTLTSWGERIVNGRHGIRETAVKCSVFENSDDQ